MNIVDLMVDLQTKIAADTGPGSIQDFCTTTFAKSCTVFLGQDVGSPPGEAEAPVIVIVGASLNKVDQSRDNVKLVLGVTVSQATTSTGTDIFTYDGFLNSHKLGELLRDFILSYKSTESMVRVVAFRTTQEILHPLFAVEIEAEFEIIRSSKGK